MSEQLHSLPRSTPEAQGIPSQSIADFLDAAESDLNALHSFMLVRHGHIVAEGWWYPYVAERTHVLFSLSKSYCATAAGLAIAEGYFSLEDTVLSFFPEDAPAEVSENLAKMRVRDLLAMATGHTEDTTGYLHRDTENNWNKAFLARPVDKEPGTHFVYNSGATYMVSAIVQKTTGQTTLDFLTPRLLEPLGIVGATWESTPQGVNVGGWGLKVRTEDIAKFGQLYLQNGVWNGKALLPTGWVGEATAKHISNGDNPESDWNQGYGFQFWRCRHNAYRGDGAFGQYCIVLPDQDAVIAITSGQGDMQTPLNLVWKHLLPAMGATPLAESDTTALTHRLQTLRLKSPTGQASSPIVASVSGITYRLENNDLSLHSVRFDFSDTTTLARETDHGPEKLSIGKEGEWITGVAALMPSMGPQPVAATGTWIAEDTYLTTLAHYETPFCPTIRARFDGNTVELEIKNNVGFGPTAPTIIRGVQQ